MSVVYIYIERERGGRERGSLLLERQLPSMSEGTLPLLNRPVGVAPSKSRPYGGKLHLAMVSSSLLFPGSTIESPNTNTAGTFALAGSPPSAVATAEMNTIKADTENIDAAADVGLDEEPQLPTWRSGGTAEWRSK